MSISLSNLAVINYSCNSKKRNIYNWVTSTKGQSVKCHQTLAKIVHNNCENWYISHILGRFGRWARDWEIIFQFVSGRLANNPEELAEIMSYMGTWKVIKINPEWNGSLNEAKRQWHNNDRNFLYNHYIHCCLFFNFLLYFSKWCILHELYIFLISNWYHSNREIRS